METLESLPSQPPLEENEQLVDELRSRAKGDLYFFSKGVLGFSKLTPKIHKPLCRLLELYEGYNESLCAPWSEYRAVLRMTLRRAKVPRDQWEARIEGIRRKGIKKLLIMMPRGWYKTTLVSICYPAWRGVRDANVRCLLVQNTSKNASAKGNMLGSAIMGSELLKFLFPDIMPTTGEKWSEDGRCLHRSGVFAESTYEFAGTRTQVTSRHFNLIIEDDTVAPDKDDLREEAILPSKTDVSQAIGWHRLVAPLFNEPSQDQNVVVGTRWFVLDLLAWVMANEKDFVVFQWAAREEEDGTPSPRGKLVWKERFDEETLKGLEASLGPYLYSCLFMNTPIQPENMLFRPEWIRYYDVEPPRLMTFTTVDPAGDPQDTKGEPDWNVVMTCGKDMQEGRIYVLEYSREKCSPSRLLQMLFAHVEKWHPAVVGIETVAYQKSLMHWIRQQQVTSGRFFQVIPVPGTRRSKGAKIRGLQPAMASGLLYFRTHMEALVNELLVYPLGTHDDLADALAMQLELWKVTPSAKESAEEWEGGPNDFDFVLSMARRVYDEQRQQTGKIAPAWGMSFPKLVFHSEGSERKLLEVL